MDLRPPVLRLEVKKFKNISPRLLERFLALMELAKFRVQQGCVRESDYERIAARLETSARSLYRWEAAYKKMGAEGLISKKSTGRKANFIRGHTAQKIQEMRKLYNWGAEVIQAHLKLDHQIIVSRYKITRFLRRKGLLVRKKCKQKKKHTSVVKVNHPGIHTQTDVKHLPHLLKNGTKCYVYNFVDHASKWSFKRAYESYGPMETRDFMHALLQVVPFTITRSQTDYGVKFTNKYISHVDDPKLHALDRFCASHGIRHVRRERITRPGRAFESARRRRVVSPY